MSVEGSRRPVFHFAGDPFGDHQLGCGGNGDRIYRHVAPCDAVFSATQTTFLAPRKKMPSLIPDTHT